MTAIDETGNTVPEPVGAEAGSMTISEDFLFEQYKELDSTLKKQLIRLLKQRENLLMDSARVVSNMKRPESDNNYGRAAMKLKEAREALEKLPW